MKFFTSSFVQYFITVAYILVLGVLSYTLYFTFQRIKVSLQNSTEEMRTVSSVSSELTRLRLQSAQLLDLSQKAIQRDYQQLSPLQQIYLKQQQMQDRHDKTDKTYLLKNSSEQLLLQQTNLIRLLEDQDRQPFNEQLGTQIFQQQEKIKTALNEMKKEWEKELSKQIILKRSDADDSLLILAGLLALHLLMFAYLVLILSYKQKIHKAEIPNIKPKIEEKNPIAQLVQQACSSELAGKKLDFVGLSDRNIPELVLKEKQTEAALNLFIRYLVTVGKPSVIDDKVRIRLTESKDKKSYKVTMTSNYIFDNYKQRSGNTLAKVTELFYMGGVDFVVEQSALRQTQATMSFNLRNFDN